MLIGHLSLRAVPLDERPQFIRRLLHQVKNTLQQRFPESAGYLVGIQAPPSRFGEGAKQVWTMELLCGSPHRRFLAQLVSENADGDQWRAEMFSKGPFSGSILTWPGALGFSVGYGLTRAFSWLFRPFVGGSQPSEWESMRAAFLDAISPPRVHGLFKCDRAARERTG